ncbi:MAG: hypothetical protein LC754_11715 [Acidobacteria bacterium]|nr:hypothetical protein [Acidobacteriota bacterium]
MKRTILMIAMLVTALAAVAYAQSSNVTWNGELSNEGAGLYTDASVASQVSTFTINPRQVTCGVGTVNANGVFGPFEMMMYSGKVESYSNSGNTIRATGDMRSITRVAGVVVEDVVHPFISIGVDNGPSRPQPNLKDRFDTHFITPFWHVGNPLCTPSELVPGGCRFGGQVFLGDVNSSAATR